MHKKYLFIMQDPPAAGIRAQESLDILLTAAAFDQDISLLFLDDGVYQLKRDQQGSAITSKHLGQALQSLVFFELKHIYVEEQSIKRRGLHAEDFILPVTVIPETRLTELMLRHDIILPC